VREKTTEWNIKNTWKYKIKIHKLIYRVFCAFGSICSWVYIINYWTQRDGCVVKHNLNLHSPFIYLSNPDSPVCSGNQQRQYGAARGDVANITCSVNSHPAPVSFRWAYNSSSHLTDIVLNTTTKGGYTDTLQYLLHSDMDFGTLLCWAANTVGVMRRPCVIHVVPAGEYSCEEIE